MTDDGESAPPRNVARSRSSLARKLVYGFRPIHLAAPVGAIVGLSGALISALKLEVIPVREWIAIFLGLIGFLAAAIIVIRYLEDDTPTLGSQYPRARYVRASGSGANEPGTLRVSREVMQMAQIKMDVRSLKREMQAFTSGTKREEIEGLVKNLSSEITTNAAANLVQEVERRLEALERSDLYHARHAMEAFGETQRRIATAIARLGRRGAVNLTLGGFITLCGAGMLWWFVIRDDLVAGTPMLYVMHFLPRLSIVVVVQVFALFFLRLYKLGLEEIKFFQNEMTNIEQRQVALSVALLQEDVDLRAQILLLIAKTDRNSVLEKGQSTIDLEKAKIEAQGGAAEMLKGLLPVILRSK